MKTFVLLVLLTVPAIGQIQSETFTACRPGHVVKPGLIPTEAQRPLWRAEGFSNEPQAAAYAATLTGDVIRVKLLHGAQNPYLVLHNTGPFSWDTYAGPTHWPVKTFTDGEIAEAAGDIKTHVALHEPWAIVSTGDPVWPVLTVFEGSAPCVDSSKRRAVSP